MFGRLLFLGILAGGMLAGLSACNTKTDGEFGTQEKDKTVTPAEVHHHHGPGPHKGMMTDLGTDHSMMVELVFSADPRRSPPTWSIITTPKKPCPSKPSR